MAVTVDKFLKLINFYYQNPVKTVRENFKTNSLIYEDSVSVYLKSLVLNDETISYIDDKDVLTVSIQTREQVVNFFSNVLYPGSYAYTTSDSTLFKKYLIDWSSSIRSLQKTMKQSGDVYALNSEDIDKAIRGFGITFVNKISLPSLAKRQRFLLSICDLYKLKGTPKGIVDALILMGRNGATVKEFWVVPKGDNLNQDIQIKWQNSIRNQQYLDSETNQWKNSDDNDFSKDIYMDYDWFQSAIETRKDPHWFYTKEEIININWSDSTSMKLPSITPYFSVEFYNNLKRYQAISSTTNYFLNKQFLAYLKGGEVSLAEFRNIWLENYSSTISLLECYTALEYATVRYSDYLLYNHLRTYMLSKKVSVPEFTHPYMFFNLVYWVWKNYDAVMRDAISQYTLPRSPYYGVYNEMIHWWLTLPLSTSDLEPAYSGSVLSKHITLFNTIDDPDSTDSRDDFAEDKRQIVTLKWKETHPFGVYNLEFKRNTDTAWSTYQSNLQIYSENMEYMFYETNNTYSYRVVRYRNQFNIPELFFMKPFSFGSVKETLQNNKILSYNYASLNDGRDSQFITDQIISRYDELQGEKSRPFEVVDTQTRSYETSTSSYPNSKFSNYLWNRYNSEFYDNISWAEDSYVDVTTHDGSALKYVNYDRYPINGLWNWACDSKYFYVSYGSAKWLRFPIVIVDADNVPDVIKNKISKFGSFEYENSDGDAYSMVSSTKYAKLSRSLMDYEWDLSQSDILHNGNFKQDSKLSRDCVKAQISLDTYAKIINLTLQDNDLVTYTINPFYAETRKTVSYYDFKYYLDCYGYVIDSYGYIHSPITSYYDDSQHYYTTCSGSWFRIPVDRFWKIGDNGDNIYNDESSLNYKYPTYGLINRYDSERLMRGYYYETSDLPLATSESFKIGDRVAIRNTTGSYPVVYVKVAYRPTSNVPKYIKDRVSYKWVETPYNDVMRVNLGINPTLIDFIDSYYNKDVMYYGYILNTLLTAYESFIRDTLNETDLDIESLLSTSSKLDQEIINFFKPKRARALLISSVLNMDTNDSSSVGVDDSIGYNPTGTIEDNTRINRTRIRQQVNDYFPLDDTIYAKNQPVYSESITEREVHTQQVIPTIRVNDGWEKLKNYTYTIGSNAISASFYAAGLGDFNGFYYYNNLNGTYINQSCRISLYFVAELQEWRWLIGEASELDQDCDNSKFISETSEVTSVYYKIETLSGDLPAGRVMIGDEVYLGDSVDSFINFNDTVEINGRDLEASLYFSRFSNTQVNGFYFYDEYKSKKYNRPVYYNLNGKILSYLETDYQWNGYNKFWIISNNKEILDIKDAEYLTYGTDNVTKDSIFYTPTEDPEDLDIYYYVRNHRICYQIQDIIDDPTLVNPIHYSRVSYPDLYTFNARNIFTLADKFAKSVEAMRYEPVGFYLFDNEIKSEFMNEGESIQYSVPCSYVTNSFGLDGRAINLEGSQYLYIDNIMMYKGIEIYDMENLTPLNSFQDVINRINSIYNEIVVSQKSKKASTSYTISLKVKPTVFNANILDSSDFSLFINSDGTLNVTTTTDVFTTPDCLVLNEWTYVTITRNSTNIHVFIGNVLQTQEDSIYISGATNFYLSCTLSNITAEEISVWNTELPSWYIDNINVYGILRRRMNYQVNESDALHCSEVRRDLFPKYNLGCPENTLSSRLRKYIIESENLTKFGEETSMMNNEYRACKDLMVQKSTDIVPLDPSSHSYVNEYMAPADFLNGKATSPWWLRSIEDFRSGPIHHNPVYMSIRQTLEDVVEVGSDGNYYDTNKKFDGDGNIDNSRIRNDQFEIITTPKSFTIDSIDLLTSMTLDTYNPDPSGEKIISNQGNTFSKDDYTSQIQQDSQYSNLIDDYKFNLMYHNEIHAVGFSGEYSKYNGVWIATNVIESKKNNDFSMCYSFNGYELVPTYQTESGYYWWEIRYNDGSNWVTELRTLVKPNRQIENKDNYYDLMNANQLDICNQKICVFNSSDYNTFSVSEYESIDQVIVDGNFNSTTWIRLPFETSDEVVGNNYKFYLWNNKLYITFPQFRAKMDCVTEWIHPSIIKPDYDAVNNGFVLINNKLYVYVKQNEITYVDYSDPSEPEVSIPSYMGWVCVTCEISSDPFNDGRVTLPWTLIYSSDITQAVVLSETISAIDAAPFGNIDETTQWDAGTTLVDVLNDMTGTDRTNRHLHLSCVDSSSAWCYDNINSYSEPLKFAETNYYEYKNNLFMRYRDPSCWIKDELIVNVIDL